MVTLKDLVELDRLNDCAYESTKQSRWKETTQRYLANMLTNNVDLIDDILNGEYTAKPTTDFYLNERGHIRRIEAPVVRDRVIQKSVTKYVLIPSLRPCLIYDNYASLEMRGTSFARKRLEIMLRRYIGRNGIDGYILLIDVRKYFENVDHDTLKLLVADRLSCVSDEVIELVNYMIDTSSRTDKGLNLGGEPPQMFAVYYLNLIDTFVKVVKGVKYYGRYMDDIFVIGKTKEELVQLLGEIEEKLADLKLEINQRKTSITKLRKGFTFLQIKYDILPSGKILKRMSHGKIVRERRRLKAFKRLYDNGQMTEGAIWNCYKSWRGTVVREHNACFKTLKEMDGLYHSLFPVHIEEERMERKDIENEIFKTAEAEDLKQVFNFLNIGD